MNFFETEEDKKERLLIREIEKDIAKLDSNILIHLDEYNIYETYICRNIPVGKYSSQMTFISNATNCIRYDANSKTPIIYEPQFETVYGRYVCVERSLRNENGKVIFDL